MLQLLRQHLPLVQHLAQKQKQSLLRKHYTAPVTGASANELARKQAEKDAEAAKIEAKERASALSS